MTQFDPAAATALYLAQLSPEAHAKAQAYTQGGHWLLLWGWLVSVLVAALVLRSGVLTALRGRIEARWPRPYTAPLVIGASYLMLDWALSLPWALYADWWREKAYGLNTQTWQAWLGESAISAAIGAAFGGLFLMALYTLIRWSRRGWWAWAGGLSAAFIIFMLMVQPVFIEPIFNHYTPAPPGPVRDAVAQMARTAGVPPDRIFIYDGSRQSNAYTANVSGLFGTARVAMSDVMFRKGADLAEVRAVVGHEMGHYAERHVLWFALIFSGLAAVAFWLVDRLFAPAARLLGARGVKGVGDPAGIPVLAALAATFGLLATPLTNTLSRTTESAADAYSLRLVNEPDGLARALVKTVEYRAATPSRLEEVIFYDHPSVSGRIRRAMDWKAAHPR